MQGKQQVTHGRAVQTMLQGYLCWSMSIFISTLNYDSILALIYILIIHQNQCWLCCLDILLWPLSWEIIKTLISPANMKQLNHRTSQKNRNILLFSYSISYLVGYSSPLPHDSFDVISQYFFPIKFQCGIREHTSDINYFLLNFYFFFLWMQFFRKHMVTSYMRYRNPLLFQLQQRKNSIILNSKMKTQQSQIRLILPGGRTKSNKNTLNSRKTYTRKKAKSKIEKNEKQGVSPDIYRKFSEYMDKRRKKFLKERLHEYYGKNFPVNYRSDYEFDEQWKQNLTTDEKSTQYEGLSHNYLEIGLSILTVITFSVVIWLNSIIHFFQMEKHELLVNKQIYIVGLVLQFANFVMKWTKKVIKKDSFQNRIKNGIKSVKIQILTISYFFAKLFITQQSQPDEWIIFQVLMWIILYAQASKKYYSLRLSSVCLHYEYQTKLLDMLFTIFIVAHFIAIILYSVTRYDPEHSWITSLDIDKQDPFLAYTYAFYFTVTTIMTVGYGDITAKNRIQVMLVSFVQIFGIIMFGFMINEIGYCISSLRKNRQAIDRNLFVVEKLRRHYHMNQELTAKVRAYLVDAKPDPDQVLPQEEQGILLKLNEEIREDVTRHNMAAVVRSSIFFICRWTRSFQDAVSRSLVHTMANPNDVLYQPIGKERIYIIRSGKVHIFAERTGSKRELKTPLKTIESNINKDISDNCYGYTAVLSSKPTKIYAISKNFTSCYYIQKQAFLDVVAQKASDFEYFHELKCRVDQMKFCQAFQVPQLESTKHHYSPSVTLLIKKQNADNSGYNKRMPALRNDRNSFRGILRVFDKKKTQHFVNTYLSSVDNNEPTLKGSIASISNINIANIGNSEQLANYVISRDISDNFHHYFESSKHYTNFYRSQNKEQVLRKHDNSFFFPKNQQSLKVSFTLQMYKEVTKTKQPAPNPLKFI